MMRYFFLLLIIAFFSFGFWQDSEPKTLEPGSKAPDFNLPGVDGKYYSLKDFEKAKVLVVIFSCNHCPTAQAYEDRIISITSDYKPKGVAVVMISPNAVNAYTPGELGYSDMGDKLDDMKVRAKDKRFNFPYLFDGDQQKASLAYGPVATPHCFVFDNKRILRYVGRLDGSEKPGTAKGEDLRNAIDAVLAGNQVQTPVTKVFGCSVKWSWKSSLVDDYYRKQAELPVTIEEINVAGVKELIKNNTEKIRLINVWATWCGPCITEFPELVTINRMYNRRAFEFITISADKMPRKNSALEFLKEQQASNKNYIFNGESIYDLIDALDPKWQGAIPFTILIEPGGKVIFRKQDTIDPHELKKLIVEHPLIGRFY